MLIDGWRRVPRGVVVLGFVSLLMDASSELVHALLPLFMVTVLGASMLVVGVIEGIAEATAMVVKVFSGYLSDLTRRRKPLVLLGDDGELVGVVGEHELYRGMLKQTEMAESDAFAPVAAS